MPRVIEKCGQCTSMYHEKCVTVCGTHLEPRCIATGGKVNVTSIPDWCPLPKLEDYADAKSEPGPLFSTRELYTRLWAKFGSKEQLRMLMEEACEVGVAANHVARGRDPHYEKIIIELADVRFMIEQVEHNLNIKEAVEMVRAELIQRKKALLFPPREEGGDDAQGRV